MKIVMNWIQAQANPPIRDNRVKNIIHKERESSLFDTCNREEDVIDHTIIART